MRAFFGMMSLIDVLQGLYLPCQCLRRKGPDKVGFALVQISSFHILYS